MALNIQKFRLTVLQQDADVPNVTAHIKHRINWRGNPTSFAKHYCTFPFSPLWKKLKGETGWQLRWVHFQNSGTDTLRCWSRGAILCGNRKAAANT